MLVYQRTICFCNIEHDSSHHWIWCSLGFVPQSKSTFSVCTSLWAKVIAHDCWVYHGIHPPLSLFSAPMFFFPACKGRVDVIAPMILVSHGIPHFQTHLNHISYQLGYIYTHTYSVYIYILYYIIFYYIYFIIYILLYIFYYIYILLYIFYYIYIIIYYYIYYYIYFIMYILLYIHNIYPIRHHE